jgi:hypothetical protein
LQDAPTVALLAELAVIVRVVVFNVEIVRVVAVPGMFGGITQSGATLYVVRNVYVAVVLAANVIDGKASPFH